MLMLLRHAATMPFEADTEIHTYRTTSPMDDDIFTMPPRRFELRCCFRHAYDVILLYFSPLELRLSMPAPRAAATPMPPLSILFSDAA